jgi:hypothetical protein
MPCSRSRRRWSGSTPWPSTRKTGRSLARPGGLRGGRARRAPAHHPLPPAGPRGDGTRRRVPDRGRVRQGLARRARPRADLARGLQGARGRTDPDRRPDLAGRDLGAAARSGPGAPGGARPRARALRAGAGGERRRRDTPPQRIEGSTCSWRRSARSGDMRAARGRRDGAALSLSGRRAFRSDRLRPGDASVAAGRGPALLPELGGATSPLAPAGAPCSGPIRAGRLSRE